MKNIGSSMANAVKNVIDDRLDRFWHEHKEEIRGQLAQTLTDAAHQNENEIKALIDERLDRFWKEHQDEIRQQVSQMVEQVYDSRRDDILNSLKAKVSELIDEKETVIDEWMKKAVQTQTRNVILTVCGFLVTVIIFLLLKRYGF
jgi:hypothetical protein